MRFATPKEAANALSAYDINEAQIRRRAKCGDFPHILVGGHVLVDIDGVAAILEAAKHEPETISTAELSELTGLKIATIRRGCSEGWLPFKLDGPHFRFVLLDVQEALRRRMTENTGRKRTM